jgi:hypothetical protein
MNMRIYGSGPNEPLAHPMAPENLRVWGFNVGIGIGVAIGIGFLYSPQLPIAIPIPIANGMNYRFCSKQLSDPFCL